MVPAQKNRFVREIKGKELRECAIITWRRGGGGVEKLEVRVRVRVRNKGENDNKREGGWM